MERTTGLPGTRKTFCRRGQSARIAEVRNSPKKRIFSMSGSNRALLSRQFSTDRRIFTWRAPISTVVGSRRRSAGRRQALRRRCPAPLGRLDRFPQRHGGLGEDLEASAGSVHENTQYLSVSDQQLVRFPHTPYLIPIT